MLIYYLLFLIVLYCIMSENYKNSNLIVVILCFLIYCIAAFRSYSVGSDTYSYIEEYIADTSFGRDLDFGFAYFNQFLSELGLSPRLYLMIVSLLIFIPVLIFICQYTKKYRAFTILLYLTISNFSFNLTGIRQSIAVGLVLIGLVLYKVVDKKLIGYVCVLGLILLACSFHNSARLCLMLIPLLWLSNKTILHYKFVRVVLFVLPIFVLFSSKAIASIVNYFMISRYEQYEAVFGDANLVAYIVVPYCIYLYVWYLFFRSKNKNWQLRFCFYCSIIYVCIAACTLYMPMLGRLEYYYSLPLICLVSNLTTEQTVSDRKLFMFIISVLSMMLFLISTPGGTLRIDNYSFF